MKKLILIVLGLLVILVFVVGTVAGSRLLKPAQETYEPGKQILADLQGPLPEENTTIVSLIDQSDPASMILSQEGPKLEARLKGSSDEVYVCGECTSSDSCDFVLLEEKEKILVEGDSVRTGKDGSATIKFDEKVEIVLASNTQIRILKFQTADDGTVQIYIEQLVGEVFFNVKYSSSGNKLYDLRIITPTAVTKQTDTPGKKQSLSGISTVQYELFAGLSAEDVQDSIQELFSTQCGAFCFEDDCSNCRIFDDLSPINLQVDDLTGNLMIEYIDAGGVQQTTSFAGQTFRYIFDGFQDSNTWLALCRALYALLNGETPSSSDITEITEGVTGTFTSITPTSNCGDGICDIYDNEDKKTCPQDCK